MHQANVAHKFWGVAHVHHTGRDEDKGGRGSSAIRTNVDSEFTIKKNEDTGACVVNTTKQRNMAGDLRFSYLLEKVKLCTDVEGFDRLCGTREV